MQSLFLKNHFECKILSRFMEIELLTVICRPCARFPKLTLRLCTLSVQSSCGHRWNFILLSQTSSIFFPGPIATF